MVKTGIIYTNESGLAISQGNTETTEVNLKAVSKKVFNDEYYIEKAIRSYEAQQMKTYTFYENEKETDSLKRFNWCERPCNSNMSLCNFTSNGEVNGYMSESLAEEKGLKQITLTWFIHKFVKPLIKENIELKNKLKEVEK